FWETPAASATSATVTRSKPRVAKSSMALSAIAWRVCRFFASRRPTSRLYPEIYSCSKNTVHVSLAPSLNDSSSERSPNACSARACDRPPPLARHRDLAGADAVRRLRRRQGVEALVPVVLDPGLLRIRGEPAHAEAVRHRHAPAERGRLPYGG